MACPSGCTCKRVTSYYYQCTPTRPPPHDAGLDARLCAVQHLSGEQERACFCKNMIVGPSVVLCVVVNTGEASGVPAERTLKSSRKVIHKSRRCVHNVVTVAQAHGQSPQQAALGRRLQRQRPRAPQARQALQTMQGLRRRTCAGRSARSAAAAAARRTAAPP